MNTELAVIHPKLEEAVLATKLSAEVMTTLKAAYAPHFAKLDELHEMAKDLTVLTPKKAGELRKALKAVRVAANKTREATKEDALKMGRAIDGVYKVLEGAISPVEEGLEQVEKAAEIAEQKRKAELSAARAAELTPFRDPQFYDLANMPEPQWVQLLADAKLAHATAKAAAEKAEAERVAAEKAAEEARVKREQEEAAERERMKAENERLAKVAAEEKAQREAAEKKAREERQAAEAKAAAERAEQQKAIEAERKKREAAEAELKAKQEADRKKKAAEELAAKKAAAAPDKQKLEQFAKTLRALEVPIMSTSEGKDALIEVQRRILNLVTFVETEASSL